MSEENDKEVEVIQRKITIPSKREVYEKGEALAKLIGEFFKKDNLDRLTRVDDKEIELLTICHAFNAAYETKTRNAILESIKELRISQYGEGRKEIIEMIKEKTVEQKEPGMLAKILGTGEKNAV